VNAPASAAKPQKPQSLAELVPKAFQDPETGVIYEIYQIIDGKKITLNFDGMPFKFKNFLFITTRVEENALTGCFIHAPKVQSEDILKLNEQLPFPATGEDGESMSKDQVMELGELDIRLQIKEDAIVKFINPKFSTVKNIKQLFSLRDDIGGSVVLDFFYYDIILLTPPFVEPEGGEGEEGQEE